MFSAITSFSWCSFIKGIYLLPLIALPSPALSFSVLSVGDGDTVRLEDGSRRVTVRLACIDAPETSQHPYGDRSRTVLSQLLPVGIDVSLRTQTTDRYGRTVAEIFTDQGNINQQMVQRGQSFAYRRYLKACDASQYLRLERQAQKLGIGVWSVGPNGIERPWDYRKGRSKNVGTIQKYRCKDIGSWAKSQQLLREGHSYLDRDNDGEACESLR